MKSAFKVLGIIALVAIIGFSMFACDNGGGVGCWSLEARGVRSAIRSDYSMSGMGGAVGFRLARP